MGIVGFCGGHYLNHSCPQIPSLFRQGFDRNRIPAPVFLGDNLLLRTKPV